MEILKCKQKHPERFNQQYNLSLCFRHFSLNFFISFFHWLENHWASNDFPWIRIEMMKSQWKLLLRFQWYWQNMLITDKVRDRENASIIMNWWQIQGIQITNCNMRNNVSAFLCVTSPLIGHSFFSHFLQFFSLCDSIHMDVLCGLWILRHIYQCNEYWK